MRRRHRRVASPSVLGLDSLMDVVTNIIGALFFVIIYVILSSSDMRAKVTTVVPATLADTEPIMVECRNNTVFFPNNEELVEKIREVARVLAKQGAPATADIVAAFQQADIKDNYYQVVCRQDGDGLKIAIEPRSDAKGENEIQITKEASTFQQALKKNDPKKHHFFFVVREDSISVFYIARYEAMKKGFKIGYHPLLRDAAFTLGGESMFKVDPRRIHR